jgi:hypothetical protein
MEWCLVKHRETLTLPVHRVQLRNGRLLELGFSGTAGMEVRGVFAQGWRSP